MTTVTQPSVLSPIPDVPFLVGIGQDLLHAIGRDSAVWAVERAAPATESIDALTACGATAYIAREWGEVRRGNPRLDSHRLCPACSWAVALAGDGIDAELKAQGPSQEERQAWSALPDPGILTRICRAIIDDRASEEMYDADHGIWAQLLGHACAHRPEMLTAEGCAEGDCDHRDEGNPCPSVLACPTCSVRAGAWAGEWEGQFEVIVPAPCSVLTVMHARFVAVAGSR